MTAPVQQPSMTAPVQQPSMTAVVPRDREPIPQPDACRVQLESLGAEFSVPESVEATGECGVDDPVKVKAIQAPTGRVELPEQPLMSCAFARQFVTWLSDVAAPVVSSLAPAKLKSLSTGPGYECRNRNGDGSGKLSEHAFGNAIDIAGITLASRTRIEIADVADPSGTHHRVLMALRVSACGYFTTVLGPGANAAHASHYHFDLGQHGKSGNYRICN
jgi:hypothetical protein